jgi:hypothetical protein
MKKETKLPFSTLMKPSQQEWLCHIKENHNIPISSIIEHALELYEANFRYNCRRLKKRRRE